jgi:hypothetical protein
MDYLEDINFTSWEAFEQHCKTTLAELDLSQFTLYHWKEAIKKTITKHEESICRAEPYKISSLGCPLCDTATRLKRYFNTFDVNSCTYCPWSMLCEASEDAASGDSICEYGNIYIADLELDYHDNLSSIRRLAIWLNLLIDLYDFTQDASDFERSLDND